VAGEYFYLNAAAGGTMSKNEKFSLSKKIFREINYLMIPLVKTLLSRDFCQTSRERISVLSTL